MCGIAGYISSEGAADRNTVQAMCDQIRHRGPDDDGFYTNQECAIGMRRLSIIDLAGGHQPISNEDGSVWIVFNGEIYNYQELRERLLSQGHRFTTNSDTEVLVHLYEQEGVEGLRRLRGMYAYAIWDNRKRSLLLVRDRLGKKPVYYTKTSAGFFFGSEIKCLRAAGVPLVPDPEGIRFYLQFGYIPDPWSAFQNVKKLPPAHWLTIDANGQIKTGRYWTTPQPLEESEKPLDEAEVCEEIRQVFDESVRLRMIADVPLGAFLSGGIDSSLVVASMARQSSRAVKTFSIGFDEDDFNELPYARMVAQKYGTDHQELVVRPDAVDLVPRLIRFFDEPFADASAIPTYLVSKFAAEQVKVALSGDGGDEFFGGYGSFFVAQDRLYADRIPGAIRSLTGTVANALPYSAYGKNFLRTISRPTPIERHIDFISFSSHFLRRKVLSPDWVLPEGYAFLQSAFGSSVLPADRDGLSQAIHFEATAKLAGDILVKVDRMSMACSLEVRSPLLDHVLAETANRIPNSWKIRNGKGKQILLKALGDRLPPELLTQPKRGFGIPLGRWFKGPLRPMLWDMLLSKRFLDRGFTTSERLNVMLKEHDSGRRDNTDFLWILLVLELWLSDHEGLSTTVGKPQLTSTL